jgi:ferric-dicitrate binding protein FerR (iron transport regulator)
MVELMLSVNKTDTIDKSAQDSIRNRLIMTMKAQRESEKERALPIGKPGGTSVTIWWAAIAASIVLVVAVVFSIRLQEPGKLAEHTLKTIDDGGENAVVTDSTELRVNPKGQKSVMLLDDGTKVWLNADSKLTYSKNFGKNGLREVHLEGEAFFDVVKNPEAPFIVHTSALNIRVLGTSFNVKSYADDSRIETTLVEGKVEIDKLVDRTRTRRNVVLQPNQKATFSKESMDINVKEVAAEEVVAWRNDRLVFKSEPFGEVVKQLERWYNVKIHVENEEYAICPLTASIEKETLEEILNFLAVTHKIGFAISGSDVYIKGSLCQ